MFEIDTVMPLKIIIGQPRYGSGFKLNIVYDKENTVVDIQTLTDNDTGRIVVRYEIPDNYYYLYCIIKLHKLGSVSTIKDFTQIVSDVGVMAFMKPIDDDANLPSSTEDFDALVPDFLRRKNINFLVALIIEFLIVLHYRPERTAQIKESRLKESSRSKPKDKLTDQDYIVSHILKPVKEYKEYISQATDYEIIREYVVPEWDRVGHTRYYKKTGKTVYIAPTKCVRHKELTKKEIRIKL